MYKVLMLALAAVLSAAFVVPSADAQTRARRAKVQAPAQAQVSAPPPEKCLRALDGTCTNPDVVEAARLRAIIIPAVRVSYFGTPAGTIGGAFIPFERFFQDDPVVFGLPTRVLVLPCCVVRSK
jgi:hypothetical protein